MFRVISIVKDDVVIVDLLDDKLLFFVKFKFLVVFIKLGMVIVGLNG